MEDNCAAAPTVGERGDAIDRHAILQLQNRFDGARQN